MIYADYINAEFGELVGKTVKAVRPLSNDECADLAWEPTMHEAPFCLIFTDGTAAVVSSDAEGNGPGWLIIADTAPAPSTKAAKMQAINALANTARGMA